MLLLQVIDALYGFLETHPLDAQETSASFTVRQLCVCCREMSVESSRVKADGFGTLLDLEEADGFGTVFDFEEVFSAFPSEDSEGEEEHPLSFSPSSKLERKPRRAHQASFLQDYHLQACKAYEESFWEPYRRYRERLKDVRVTQIIVRRNGMVESYSGPLNATALCRVHNAKRARFFEADVEADVHHKRRLFARYDRRSGGKHVFRQYRPTYVEDILWTRYVYITLHLHEGQHALHEMRLSRDHERSLFAGPPGKEWRCTKTFAEGRKEFYEGGYGKESLCLVKNRFNDEAHYCGDKGYERLEKKVFAHPASSAHYQGERSRCDALANVQMILYKGSQDEEWISEKLFFNGVKERFAKEGGRHFLVCREYPDGSQDIFHAGRKRATFVRSDYEPHNENWKRNRWGPF